METKSDKELVRRCLDGDGEAWSNFVDRFSGLVYWAIKRKLGRCYSVYLMSDVEDIYQRFFMGVWERKSLASVIGRNNIAPWIIVLASNLTIDFIRGKKREQDLFQYSLTAEIPDVDNDSILFAEEKVGLLDEAMIALKEKERACLELCYVSRKTHKEIADIFNVPPNSVSTTIARAKSKIKRFIEKKEKKN